MRCRKKVIGSLLAASMCCMPLLDGCSSRQEASAVQKEAEHEEGADFDETKDAGIWGNFLWRTLRGILIRRKCLQTMT